MKQATPVLLLLLLVMVWALAGCQPADTASAAPPAIDTGIDPESWAYISAGEFLRGQHNHETMVDYDFEIMVTEVTNDQYARYLKQALASDDVRIQEDEVVGYYPGDEFHGYEHEEEIAAGDWNHLSLAHDGLRLAYEDHSFTARSGYENHPMVLVTWFGAKAYCEYYGWRLPTEVEWEKAARGADGRPFPWGDEIQRNNANYYSSHDVFEKIVGGLGDTSPAGFYNGQTYDGYVTIDSPSPYGLYDMAGNVWEWTGDVYENQHYRYLRGGSKENYAYNLRIWTRNSAGPDYASANVGFRCARDN